MFVLISLRKVDHCGGARIGWARRPRESGYGHLDYAERCSGTRDQAKMQRMRFIHAAFAFTTLLVLSCGLPGGDASDPASYLYPLFHPHCRDAFGYGGPH